MIKIPSFSRRRLVAALLTLSPLSGAACSDGHAPTATSSPAATSTTATVTASATASASAPASAATPAPAKPSNFISVAPLSGYVRLFPVKGALILASGTFAASSREEKGTEIGFIKGDKVEFNPKYHLSAEIYMLTAIQGAWPDSVLVLHNTRLGAASQDKLGPFGFTASSAIMQSGWIGTAQIGLNLVAMRSRSDGRAATVDTLQSQGPPLDYELARDEAAPCATQASVVAPTAICATTTGTLLSAGKKCDGSTAVERWPAPGKPSTVTDVPVTRKLHSRMRLVPGVKGDAWLFADDLVYFDGATWKVQAPPPHTIYLVDGSVADDGTLWAQASGGSGGLVALQNGAWREEPLPGGEHPSDIAITKDGTVWVTTKTSLLRTRRPTD